MKALSLTQPWCEVILHHGKRIENRTAWKGCSYRGPILLHASKSVGTRVDFDDTVESILGILGLGIGSDASKALESMHVGMDNRVGHCWRPLPSMPRGGIVGRARIAGVVRDGPIANPVQRRWWFDGFALVLADVEPLPFVPWKGALGLFEVPDDYATRAAA